MSFFIKKQFIDKHIMSIINCFFIPVCINVDYISASTYIMPTPLPPQIGERIQRRLFRPYVPLLFILISVLVRNNERDLFDDDHGRSASDVGDQSVVDDIQPQAGKIIVVDCG